jgi:hypothetical protein
MVAPVPLVSMGGGLEMFEQHARDWCLLRHVSYGNGIDHIEQELSHLGVGCIEACQTNTVSRLKQYTSELVTAPLRQPLRLLSP